MIFGAAGASSGAATTGGLVASGEGTCSKLLWPNPSELLRFGVSGGGLLADAAAWVGVAGGWVAELNSAQRGHLRFVSERENDYDARMGSRSWRTHMTHLTAVAASSLDR